MLHTYALVVILAQIFRAPRGSSGPPGRNAWPTSLKGNVPLVATAVSTVVGSVSASAEVHSMMEQLAPIYGLHLGENKLKAFLPGVSARGLSELRGNLLAFT